MGLLDESGAAGFCKAGRDEEYSGSATKGSFIELEFIDDEVLVEDGKSDTRGASGEDEAVVTTKVVLVREDGECCSASVLVGEGDDICPTFFLYPALGGRTPLELGDDAVQPLEGERLLNSAMMPVGDARRASRRDGFFARINLNSSCLWAMIS